jgi:hypothetical protein
MRVSKRRDGVLFAMHAKKLKENKLKVKSFIGKSRVVKRQPS